MNENLDPSDDLTARLGALGSRPVDPAVQSEHLTAMAGTNWARTGSLRGGFVARVKLGAALVAGFLLGATGLATAGALGPLQPIAATAVEAATPLEVPHGAKDKAAQAAKTTPDGVHGTARFITDCVKAENGEYAKNHGQYLKQERAKGEAAYAAAKASDCGKPLSSLGSDDESPEVEDESPEVEDDDADKTACAPNASAADASGKPACEDAGDNPKGPSADKANNGNNGKANGNEGKIPETTPVTPEAAEDNSQGAENAPENTPGPTTTTTEGETPTGS